jgi:probable rRNA maturation factor
VTPHPLSVEVLDQTRRLTPVQLSWIIQCTEKAVRRLAAAGEVRVRVIDDAEMAKAHLEFADVPGTTDVLTFDMSEPELSVLPEGGPRLDYPDSDSIVFVLDTDILICVDEAERHASAGRYPVERELLLYVVHGVLHCLGMDDHEEADAAAMHRMEDSVLEAIGVGPVYSARPA